MSRLELRFCRWWLELNAISQLCLAFLASFILTKTLEIVRIYFNNHAQLLVIFCLIFVFIVMATSIAKNSATSNFDKLTGLNSRYYYDCAWPALEADAIRRGAHLWAIFIDLDCLKRINDTYGHRTGDYFLQYVASRVKQFVRSSDLCARIGGDEIIISGIGKDEYAAEVLASRIIDDIVTWELNLNGTAIKVSASVGWAIAKPTDMTFLEIVETADERMYAMKRRDK